MRQQLIDLFSQVLERDCNVLIKNEFYEIEFIQLQQSPSSLEQFLSECQKFLANYWPESVELQQSAIQIKRSEKFEEGLDHLNRMVRLHEIARFGSEEHLKDLLEQPQAINVTNFENENLLISAVYAMNKATAEFLINQGINVNHQDNGGATALHIAIGGHSKDCKFINCFPIVELLLKAGSDISIQTKKGETALQVAERVEYHEVVKLIKTSMLTPEVQYEAKPKSSPVLSDLFSQIKFSPNKEKQPETSVVHQPHC